MKKLIIAFVLLISLISFTGCGSKSSKTIVGKWALGSYVYTFNEDKTLIRANQGHSVPVDVELKECIPPEILYHGTGMKYVASIDSQGLLSKSRLYVHMSADMDTARNVGSRHGKPVIYAIDCQSMAADGYKFYLSKNHVWLTKHVPANYLSKLL